jgi:hypothetical protein
MGNGENMKPYYECHITFVAPKQNGKELEELTQWKFSQIDGDPVLGSGIKSYLTKHYPARITTDFIISQMDDIAIQMLNFNYEVLRQKIELVVYDTKQNSEIKENV